ncbi:hypothetical protein [Brachyspira pilosicoli]|uniref:hypothetical protein n=1 Tax=Brachyspira pilosicoli TaxID=52584 RepID=UPI0012F4AACF|nr:hypothetical protein [Brachyspira pilosicoli]
MPKKVNVYKILISCPSDITKEVDIIKEEVNAINSSFLKNFNVRLSYSHWKDDISPEYGDRPQEIINNQIVRNSDFIIAIFGEKIGSDTGKFSSGTIEEINEIIKKSNKNVFVYFSNKPINRDKINEVSKDLKEIDKFKNEYGANGIYDTYNDNKEFRTKIRKQLNKLVSDIIDYDHSNQYKEKENEKKMYRLLNRIKNKFYFGILSVVSIIFMLFIVNPIEVIPESYKGIIYSLICFINLSVFFFIHLVHE